MKVKKPLLTGARLREVLSYDPISGHFTRLIQMGSRGAPNTRAGTLDADSGYRVIRIDGRNYYEHRLAWLYVHGIWPPRSDHKNLVRDQNGISNIRAATPSQNSANVPVRSTNLLGIKGVSYAKRNKKFMARITKDGVVTYLGFFDVAADAGAAYAAAAKRMFGEFART